MQLANFDYGSDADQQINEQMPINSHQTVTAGNSNSVGGGGSNGGSGNGSSNSGGGGGSSGSGNAGSSELNFTPIAATKWSPNSKVSKKLKKYTHILFLFLLYKSNFASMFTTYLYNTYTEILRYIQHI